MVEYIRSHGPVASYDIAARCGNVIPPEIASPKYRQRQRQRSSFSKDLMTQVREGRLIYVIEELCRLRRIGQIKRTGKKAENSRSSMWVAVTDDSTAGA